MYLYSISIVVSKYSERKVMFSYTIVAGNKIIEIYIYVCIYIYISTYKFKRAFFRHDRRTAPKFGTHVWIETRLALTKKIDQPHPRGD